MAQESPCSSARHIARSVSPSISVPRRERARAHMHLGLLFARFRTRCAQRWLIVASLHGFPTGSLLAGNPCLWLADDKETAHGSSTTPGQRSGCLGGRAEGQKGAEGACFARMRVEHLSGGDLVVEACPANEIQE